ncbi:MAG: N-acetylmuramic acid 6-phosphate etherase [Vicinamibacterales bacterium]|nr:N-acetylmuramic acid 6-phosphate etherase [Vicinamibacterales bacterium]
MPSSKWQALPTEARNPRSRALDTRPTLDIVDLMVAEDRAVVAAVRRERARIARGAEMLADALGRDGRLLLVGAGTSGRLGVLEAAEIPPTFGASPRTVQAVMAGGQRAVFRAREGVEDDEALGQRTMRRRRPSGRDVVIGITASGVTPFVRGALVAARAGGARTVLVTCGSTTALADLADLVIAPQTGPEVVTGSTRLKAGTATKMVLNMLTTIAMVRIGKTYGHLMVDVQATNAKLKDRARRIVSAIAGVDDRRAAALLRRAGGNVKVAVVMAKTGVTASRARARLAAARGSLRRGLAP